MNLQFMKHYQTSYFSIKKNTRINKNKINTNSTIKFKSYILSRIKQISRQCVKKSFILLKIKITISVLHIKT